MCVTWGPEGARSVEARLDTPDGDPRLLLDPSVWWVLPCSDVLAEHSLSRLVCLALYGCVEVVVRFVGPTGELVWCFAEVGPTIAFPLVDECTVRLAVRLSTKP